MSDKNGTPVVNTQQGDPRKVPVTLTVTGSPQAEQSDGFAGFVPDERQLPQIPRIDEGNENGHVNEIGEDALNDQGNQSPSEIRRSSQRSGNY